MPPEDRILCGWRVRSELPLPMLPPWLGGGESPDITVRMGKVPVRLECVVADTPLLQIDRDGSVRFAMEGVATYLVNATGSGIVVDAQLNAAASDIRVFFLGTVLGILCFRRNRFPLHASCVKIGDKAVAFAAPSGTGKSTLAAALVAQGYALVADDVTTIRLDAVDTAAAFPTVPILKLKAAVSEQLGFIGNATEYPISDAEKRYLTVADAFASEPLPLAAVYHLRSGTDIRHPRCEQLTGMAAVASLHRMTYRRQMATFMGLGATIFTSAACLAETTPQYRLDIPYGLDVLPDVAALIAQRHLMG
jgi:hypothetical protein